MKYKFRRYSFWIICLIVCISVLTFVEVETNMPSSVFFGLCVTLITLFISIINNYQTSDKFFKELFTEFNQRYDRMNCFLNQVKETGTLNDKDTQRVIDYLNLCAEEYMWVKRGRLPEHIWNSWKNGIKLHLEKEPIREIFKEEQRKWKSSYYGFFEDMNLFT